MATYLDNAGVTQILTKIKSLLAKKAEITAIPTKVSQLTNDSSYQNPSDVSTKISTELEKLKWDERDDVVVQDTQATVFVSNVSQKNGKIKVTSLNYADAFAYALSNAAYYDKVVSKDTVNSMISSAVSKITSFEYKIVETLPSTSEGKKGVIYLIAHSGSTNQNSYDEYIFLPAEGNTAARYEKIGTTDIDLTPYAKKTDIPKKVSQLTNDSSFATTSGVSSSISTAVNNLTKADTAETGKYVSAVSQKNGVITVTRANLPAVGTADSPISNATIESIFTQVFG